MARAKRVEEDVSDDVRWLAPEEQAFWRAYLHAGIRLFDRLERDLLTTYGLSLGDYEILAHLSEAPSRRLRMSELADKCLVSRSRLTHRVDKLENDGLIVRVACPTDRRGAYAAMTDNGWERLVAAAPLHVEGVRRDLVDVVPADLQRALTERLDGVGAPGSREA